MLPEPWAEVRVGIRVETYSQSCGYIWQLPEIIRLIVRTSVEKTASLPKPIRTRGRVRFRFRVRVRVRFRVRVMVM